jgi:hypothetical protein
MRLESLTSNRCGSHAVRRTTQMATLQYKAMIVAIAQDGALLSDTHREKKMPKIAYKRK